VERELIAKPALLEDGEDWQVFHLPTHPSHFYDVHRIEFDTSISVRTEGSPHLLMLVEGTSLRLETNSGRHQRFNYAETFVVPAAAGSYKLINEGAAAAKVVKAYLKSSWKEPNEQG
jgi:hypothetical protein